MGLFAISSLLALTLLPLPTPARPVTPPVLDPRQSSSAPTRTGGDLAFNIAFSLALLFALLGSFAWFATGRTVAQLIESFNQLCIALVAVSERLSEFRLSTLVEMAAATFLDADTANTSRRGASYPTATVPWYRFQIGGVGRFGGTLGGGNPPTLARST
ncbi:hypothetical protein V8E53_011998 [Lactarius tabidus]